MDKNMASQVPLYIYFSSLLEQERLNEEKRQEGEGGEKF